MFKIKNSFCFVTQIVLMLSFAFEMSIIIKEERTKLTRKIISFDSLQLAKPIVIPC